MTNDGHAILTTALLTLRLHTPRLHHDCSIMRRPSDGQTISLLNTARLTTAKLTAAAQGTHVGEHLLARLAGLMVEQLLLVL